MFSLEVCLTPDVLKYYNLHNKNVVVIDILRATSCMTTALACGIAKIAPVRELEDCKAYKQQGFITAGERGGQKVEGFDLGNSPFSYQNPELIGKNIALTTSNGTLAIDMSKKDADKIIIGSFLNIKNVVDYLVKEQKNTILLCAGWKGKPNLEDTFYAGALLFELYDISQNWIDDSCIMAYHTFLEGKNNPLEFLSKSSHYQRLLNFGNLEDIKFCLTHNVYDVLPMMEGDFLIQK
jgi:2-phosphosulfolactate phosphatase